MCSRTCRSFSALERPPFGALSVLATTSVTAIAPIPPAMPRLDDSSTALLHAGENAGKRVRRAWDGFCDFALRDNVLEVAVGLMYGARHIKHSC